MTPQQQILNNDLPHTDEFKTLVDKVDNLTNGQQEIKGTLQQELESQENFKVYVQDEFNKGTAKFARFEARIDEIEDKMEKGLEKIAESQNRLTQEIKEEKTAKMSKQLEKLLDEKEKREENVSAMKRNIIVGIAIAVSGIAITYIAYTLGLTPPK